MSGIYSLLSKRIVVVVVGTVVHTHTHTRTRSGLTYYAHVYVSTSILSRRWLFHWLPSSNISSSGNGRSSSRSWSSGRPQQLHWPANLPSTDRQGWSAWSLLHMYSCISGWQLGWVAASERMQTSVVIRSVAVATIAVIAATSYPPHTHLCLYICMSVCRYGSVQLPHHTVGPLLCARYVRTFLFATIDLRNR